LLKNSLCGNVLRGHGFTARCKILLDLDKCPITTSQLAENSFTERDVEVLYQGMTLVVPKQQPSKPGALERFRFYCRPALKGHGFSRAAKRQ
jgi:hypothetical protein